jgi:hypothetical protein
VPLEISSSLRNPGREKSHTDPGTADIQMYRHFRIHKISSRVEGPLEGRGTLAHARPRPRVQFIRKKHDFNQDDPDSYRLAAIVA